MVAGEREIIMDYRIAAFLIFAPLWTYCCGMGGMAAAMNGSSRGRVLPIVGWFVAAITGMAGMLFMIATVPDLARHYF